jgi:tetratricopeptide (TPR) repeat protein
LSPSAKLKTLNQEELTKTATKRHLEPPRLLSQLRGDLDWIVLKCLEKDRTRRYATANALSMDIERYLQQEPIVARPPSQLYRLHKLVRRHRMVCLFAATAVAALLLGTFVSTLMFLRERDARGSEARLRKEAEMREKASHVAALVTKRRFEEADKLVADVPLREASIEVAAELRALGDWHATNNRWRQAAERFGSLIRVDQLDGPEVSSLDQLRLAAALLQAGDRHGYEQWRRTMLARLTPSVGPLPNPIITACLLLPAGSDLLQRLAAASHADSSSHPTAQGRQPSAGNQVGWSSAMLLLEYRRGDLADAAYERFLAENAPRLATFCLVQAMASWQLKDYWGAMMTWTKGYVLVQAGARQGLLTVAARSEILPGLGEPTYLQAPWYDWAVAGLLMREWDETLAQADQSVRLALDGPPALEQVALVRAVGQWHALRGEWSDSLRCSQFCLKANQADSLDHATMDFYDAAVACLELGDQTRYLRLRDEMASRFQDPDERTAQRTLSVNLILPIDARTATRLEPFAARLTRALQERTSENDFVSSILLALFDFRRANYTNAIAGARRSAANISGVAMPNALQHLIVAMSVFQLGNHSAAAEELEPVQNVITTGFNLDFDMWHWRDWFLVRSLFREASSTFSPSAPPQPGAAAR